VHLRACVHACLKIKHLTSLENKSYLKVQNKRKFEDFPKIFIEIHKICMYSLTFLLDRVFKYFAICYILQCRAFDC
jgi:hypothetical protein